MRHQRKTVKLGRSQAHRDALLANQAVSLIEHSRIKTTLAKAKAVRPFAERLVTQGKNNTLHTPRTPLSYQRHNQGAVHKLFADVAPRCAERNGGYTRIIKLGPRNSDAAPMALLEWVDGSGVQVEEAKPTPAKKTAAKPRAKKTEDASAEGVEKEAKKPRAKKTETPEESPSAE